ncbi:MAG: T9SS type A sorting domain-containing protein [Saprospiraceae bacterium]|nr:T9SS type A sorting domain-containing protein [Saprospiraceae bacterium]
MPCTNSSPHHYYLYHCGVSDATEVVRVACGVSSIPMPLCSEVVQMCEGDRNRECIKFYNGASCGCYCVNVTLVDGSTSTAIISPPFQQFAYLCFDQEIDTYTAYEVNCDISCGGEGEKTTLNQDKKTDNINEEVKDIFKGIQIIDHGKVEYKIFPNPTQGQINIEMKQPNCLVSIHDMSGKVVEENISLNEGTNTINVDTSSNLYFFIIYNEKGEVVNIERVIVQK